MAIDGTNMILAGSNNADPVISSAKTSGWIMNVHKDTQATTWLKSTPDNFKTILKLAIRSSSTVYVILKEDTNGYVGV